MQIKKLIREREHTIYQLRRAKVKVATPSKEVRRLAEDAGPMDDVFFLRLADDNGTMEEIISTIIGVPVKVIHSVAQYAIPNVGSMGVRLDSYSEIIVTAELMQDCIWGKKGAMVDVEVQGEDNDDHEFRVFYNGASMIINKTPPKTKFKDIPLAILIYISKFDVFKEGQILYETIKADLRTGKRRRSPVSEFYVNTANLDLFASNESERLQKISRLMKVFRDLEWYDEEFPAFSKRKRMLHEEEVDEMSKELQMIIDDREKILKEEIDRLKEKNDELQRENVEHQRERVEQQRKIDQLQKYCLSLGGNIAEDM